MKKIEHKNTRLAYLEQLLRKVEEVRETNNRICEELARLRAEEQERLLQEESLSECLVVDAQIVSMVIKLMVWFIRKGWIRARKKNSVRYIARLIGENFYFCRNGHTDKYLKSSTVVSYIKSEMAAEEYCQQAIEPLEQMYEWLGEEIKRLKIDGYPDKKKV